jgi:hypothetical protein
MEGIPIPRGQAAEQVEAQFRELLAADTGRLMTEAYRARRRALGAATVSSIALGGAAYLASERDRPPVVAALVVLGTSLAYQALDYRIEAARNDVAADQRELDEVLTDLERSLGRIEAQEGHAAS